MSAPPAARGRTPDAGAAARRLASVTFIFQPASAGEQSPAYLDDRDANRQPICRALGELVSEHEKHLGPLLARRRSIDLLSRRRSIDGGDRRGAGWADAYIGGMRPAALFQTLRVARRYQIRACGIPVGSRPVYLGHKYSAKRMMNEALHYRALRVRSYKLSRRQWYSVDR